MDIKSELTNRGYSSLGGKLFKKVFRNPVDKGVLFTIDVDFVHQEIYLDHPSVLTLEEDVPFRWSGDLITVIALEDFAYSL